MGKANGTFSGNKHLAYLTGLMKREKIKMIIQSNYYESKFAHMIADKTGATVQTLPAFVGGVPEAQDYFSLFDKINEVFIHNLKSGS